MEGSRCILVKRSDLITSLRKMEKECTVWRGKEVWAVRGGGGGGWWSGWQLVGLHLDLSQANGMTSGPWHRLSLSQFLSLKPRG